MALYSEQNLKSDLAGRIAHFVQVLQELRSGRANTGMVANLSVEAYGMQNPLSTIARVDLDGPLSIVITPYDKNILDNVLKAIQDANQGFNPASDGEKVRINVPPLTEETRKQTVKDMYTKMEDSRVEVRNMRRKYMDIVDKLDGVSEDEQKRAREAIQKEVDATNTKLEELAKQKEEDIMKV